MDELSGLAHSLRTPGRLLAIEDSGNEPGITVLKTDGEVTGFVRVEGAQNVDWEDIATGRSAGGGPLVYVADIGDNRAQRDTVQVYRVAEPVSRATVRRHPPTGSTSAIRTARTTPRLCSSTPFVTSS